MVFGNDFIAFQAGQTLQPHVQDRLGLHIGQFKTLDQTGFGLTGRRRFTDQGHHIIQVIQGNLEPFEDVGPGFGLVEIKAGAPQHDLFTVADKMLQYLFQREQFRAVIDNRQENDTETVLHLGVFVELIDDNFGHVVPFDADGYPHTVTIRLIPDKTDPVDLFVADHTGDLLYQAGLVDLVG